MAKSNSVDETRIAERLDAIGFVWEPHEADWEVMFAELKRYRDEHGHCNVPQKWEENPELGVKSLADATLRWKEKIFLRSCASQAF